MEQQQEFTIDNPGAANWAVEKVKEERARRDLFIEAAEAQIQRLTGQIAEAREKCDNNTAGLLFKLDEYLDTAPVRKAKTQVSLDLPAGKLVRKLPATEYVRDDEQLIEDLRGTGYVGTKPVLKWADLKKDIEVVDGAVFLKTTGEVLTGVTTVKKPATFDIK